MRFITKKYCLEIYKKNMFSFYYTIYIYHENFAYGGVYPINDKNLSNFSWANKFKENGYMRHKAKMSKLEIDQMKKDLLKIDKLVAFV